MNSQMPLLCLPILRKENVANPSINKILQNASHIWPGFENMPEGYWQPDNYAFTPKIAKACFDDLSAMSEAALYGMPLHSILGSQDKKLEVKSMEESNMLTQFAKTGEAETSNFVDNTHALQAAQKIILWSWLLEERFNEINELTSNYSSSIKNLADTLGIDQDENFKDIEQIETALESTDALLPPWKLLLENVAIFLPTPCKIVVNHKDMAEHILDACADIIQDFSHVNESTNDTMDQNFKECHTSIGHILNKTERQMQASPWLANKIHFLLLENI